MPKLEYNPLVIQTLAFLLIFLSEGESYFAIKQMVEDSINFLRDKDSEAMKLMRWHFTLTENDFHL